MKAIFLVLVLFATLSVYAVRAEEAPPVAEGQPVTEGQPLKVASSERDRLMELAGKEVVVSGRVNSTNTTVKGEITFLNFGGESRRDFVVVFFPRYRDAFGSGDPKNDYTGKLVEVSGVVEIYKDQPQIKLTAPAQIKIMPDNP